MTRSTFSILCGVLIFAVLAPKFAAQSAECSVICARNEECIIVQSTPTCIRKREFILHHDGEPYYSVCSSNDDCTRSTYCTEDMQCKPR